MIKPIVAVALLVSSAGCIGLVEEHDVKECRDGTGYFVEAQHHPGFIGPEYQYMFYSLTRDGVLTYVRADHGWGGATGSGKIVIKPGALHNITSAQVKQELQRAGVYSSAKDFNVSVSWRDTVSESRFAALCDEVLSEFYAYRARYEANNIADCDGFTFEVSTMRGVHTSYSYCEAGPQGVRDRFDDMVKDAWKKFRLDGL